MLQALLALALAAAAQGPAPSVTQAGWLAGCWTMTAGPRSVTEYWLGPEGGTMIGVSRTVSGGKTVDYEFLLIREGAGGLEYVAKPARQAETTFTSTSVGASEIVFENPAHDFPTRIAYKRRNDGIVATISGTMNGKPRSIDFNYTAGNCPK